MPAGRAGPARPENGTIDSARAAREFGAHTLEALSTAVLVAAVDGRVLYMNAGAESLLGLSRNQVVGHRLANFVPRFAELHELIARAVEREQTFGHRLHVVNPQQDTDDVEVLCRVSPYLEQPEPRAIVEMLDATPWRQVDREQARISQHDASRRIIRQLAHEVRNPLGGIRGAAQLLERELIERGLDEYTQVIVREADRLVALTEELLGPAQQLKLTRLNIHELIERVRVLVESEAPDGISVVRDYDPSLPPVDVDADHVIQALLNVARNAVQAMGSQGQLTIRSRALANTMIANRRHRLAISIEIEDDGPGIEPELQQSVFYPLVTGRTDGTGLGLALAQDLITRHGGVIEFESRPHRTVFFVRIPAEI